MSSAVPIICGACGEEIDPAGGIMSINGLRPRYHPNCVMATDVMPMAKRIEELDAALAEWREKYALTEDGREFVSIPLGVFDSLLKTK